MKLYKSYPEPNDRMGMLRTLGAVKDACIIEFGTAGTTHFAVKAMMQQGGLQANLYSTGLDDSEITFGSHKKLEQAIREAESLHEPKHIFIMASSVTAVIGLDLGSICTMLQDKTKAQLIPVTTGGFRGDFDLGVKNARKLLQETGLSV